jgi:FKBP-type peptidyl-prolyl cis-trans isomerase
VKKFPTMVAVTLAVIAASAGAQDMKKAGAQGSAPAPDFKDAKAKVSYAIGQQVAENIQRNGLEIDIDALVKGIHDAMAGAKPAYTPVELTQAQNFYRQEMMTKLAAKTKAVGEKNKKEGDAYLAANKAKPNVKTTPSGLQYRVIKEGTGKTPKLSDTVTANYRGTLIDGTEFDSSDKHGGPQSFAVRGVIRGWIEALQGMKEGSKWELVIPSDLAYGPEGNRDIPSNAVLLFDIELLKIQTER